MLLLLAVGMVVKFDTCNESTCSVMEAYLHTVLVIDRFLLVPAQHLMRASGPPLCQSETKAAENSEISMYTSIRMRVKWVWTTDSTWPQLQTVRIMHALIKRNCNGTSTI